MARSPFGLLAGGVNNTLRLLLRLPVHLFHWRGQFLLGHRFMLLIHTGRRTGQRHETVLEVMEYRTPGPELIVMSGFGRNAGWLRNIRATPDPRVVIGRQHFIASFRELDEADATRVVESYERRSRLMAPIVRAVLSRLLGWPYRGSADDRRRLVRQLPLIAFRPAARDADG